MKYIDADRLKAEIKKKLNEIVAEALDPDANIVRLASAKYKKDALSDAISIIDTLQQEQTEVDLEKEIKRYLQEEHDRDTTVGDVARHFYKLGLNTRKEE